MENKEEIFMAKLDTLLVKVTEASTRLEQLDEMKADHRNLEDKVLKLHTRIDAIYLKVTAVGSIIAALGHFLGSIL